MSRVGIKPVQIADGVKVEVQDQTVTVSGAKGSLTQIVPKDVTVEVKDGEVIVIPASQAREARANWGLSRALIQNMVTGVTEGYSKKLEINGVGYRAQMQGKDLKLSLGFSHDVIYQAPEGVEIKCPQQTEIEVSGIDKQKVGFAAAKIRSFRPPEPYKGKGVKYEGEYVRRKEGKKK